MFCIPARNKITANPMYLPVRMSIKGLDVDLVGERKIAGQTYPAGPISALGPGSHRIRIW
jgi:hypothetical protein